MSAVDVRPIAARLACDVADRDLADCRALLADLSHEDLIAVAIVLASSVDPDKPLGVVESHEMTVRRIVRATVARSSVTVEDVLSGARGRPIADARQIVAWVAAAQGLSSVAIGRVLGRDHSTILHSILRVTSTPAMHRRAQGVLEAVQGYDDLSPAYADELIDWVAVERVMEGDRAVAKVLNRAERQEVGRQWLAAGGTLTSLTKATGWNTRRLVKTSKETAA